MDPSFSINSVFGAENTFYQKFKHSQLCGFLRMCQFQAKNLNHVRVLWEYIQFTLVIEKTPFCGRKHPFVGENTLLWSDA